MSTQPSVKLISFDLPTATAIIEVSLADPNRSIEHQVLRTIKPFRCPKNPQVREGVMLMFHNPRMSPEQASRQICNSAKLERAIEYWAQKLITVGVK